MQIITRPYSVNQKQYIRSQLLNTTSIDVSTLTSSVDIIILICDREARDVKSLLVK